MRCTAVLGYLIAPWNFIKQMSIDHPIVQFNLCKNYSQRNKETASLLHNFDLPSIFILIQRLRKLSRKISMRISPVYSQNLLVYSQNLPVYSQNLPVYSQNLPVYSQNLPVYSQNLPLNLVLCSSKLNKKVSEVKLKGKAFWHLKDDTVLKTDATFQSSLDLCVFR